MRISRATAQGQRGYQEDRFVVATVPDGKLIAIMDGHGGAGVSSYIAQVLPRIWKKHFVAGWPMGWNAALDMLTGSLVPDRIPHLFPRVVMGFVFSELNQLTKYMNEGSTVSLVYIPTPANGSEDTCITIAVLGDSPVLVIDGDSVDIGPMHNARSNPKELKAAKARGAFYFNGYIGTHFSGGGIQMTRVMGDAELDKVLNREPEIYQREVGPGSVLLMASDGLFDPSHEDIQPQVQVCVEQIKKGATAKALVEQAVALPTGDNVTAIIVRFGNKKSRHVTKKESGGLVPCPA